VRRLLKLLKVSRDIHSYGTSPSGKAELLSIGLLSSCGVCSQWKGCRGLDYVIIKW